MRSIQQARASACALRTPEPSLHTQPNVSRFESEHGDGPSVSPWGSRRRGAYLVWSVDW